MTEKSAIERLNELVGLEAVKRHVTGNVSLWKKAPLGPTNLTRGTHSMHMAFWGNPGTGKSLVASLMGEIFRDAGFLKRGHVVTANRSDLVAEYVGQTATKTNVLIDKAMDGVLFLDEAHQFLREGDDPFGMEALYTLIARMDQARKRLCVIFAGYREPLVRFLAWNPGLKRRVTNVIGFEDYSSSELVEIFRLMAGEKEIGGMPPIAPEAMDIVEKVLVRLHKTRAPVLWGNAIEVHNLLDAIYASWADRVDSDGGEKIILADDIPKKYKSLIMADEDIDRILVEINRLTGLDQVKKFIQNLVIIVHHDNQRKAAGLAKAESPMQHMLFMGNPGTGKTTVARLMGEIFKALGILSRGHVVAVTGGDLVGQFVGEGVIKTKEKVREALGGILFIDEIYNLTRGSIGESYGADALHNVLVPAMTDYKDQLVVIGAGYTHELEEFLKKNEGLRSRFVHQVNFHDFNAEELLTIFERYAEKNNYRMSAGCREALAHSFAAVVASKPKDFGNARVVEGEYFGTMRRNLATRTFKLTNPIKEDLCTFIADDLPESLRQQAVK